MYQVTTLIPMVVFPSFLPTWIFSLSEWHCHPETQTAKLEIQESPLIPLPSWFLISNWALYPINLYSPSPSPDSISPQFLSSGSLLSLSPTSLSIFHSHQSHLLKPRSEFMILLFKALQVCPIAWWSYTLTEFSLASYPHGFNTYR